jgi:hypothetical protein
MKAVFSISKGELKGDSVPEKTKMTKCIYNIGYWLMVDFG